MSSRILSRNQRGFEVEIEEGASVSLPQASDPRHPNWRWPHYVNNPVRFGNYVLRLHRQMGLRIVFPAGAFQRFAAKYWDLKPETLCRAAYLAAIRSKHPFSPKFIKAQLSEVPHTPVSIKLF